MDIVQMLNNQYNKYSILPVIQYNLLVISILLLTLPRNY